MLQDSNFELYIYMKNTFFKYISILFVRFLLCILYVWNMFLWKYLLHETPSVSEEYFEIYLFCLWDSYYEFYMYGTYSYENTYYMRLQVWAKNISRYIYCVCEIPTVNFICTECTTINYCTRLKSMRFVYRVYLEIP
jgi:hypothetical protein